MNPVKNLLCILSLSDTDKFTIKYATHIAKFTGVENIYVNFINELQNVPEYIKYVYPRNVFKLNEDIIHKMREDIVAVNVSNIKAKVHFNVFDEGSIHDNCLKFIAEKQIDLVIYRKNIENPDSVSFATKLVRRSICSVLIITKNYSTFSRILVPVDFSEHSKEALEAGIYLSKLADISMINLLHVVEISSINMIKSAHDYEKNIIMLKNYVKEDGIKFLKSCDTRGVEINTIYDISEKIEKGIMKVSNMKKIDLVIVGAQGRTSGISIFLGSVTDSLIKELSVPLLVIKKKGTGLDILKRLFIN